MYTSVWLMCACLWCMFVRDSVCVCVCVCVTVCAHVYTCGKCSTRHPFALYATNFQDFPCWILSLRENNAKVINFKNFCTLIKLQRSGYSKISIYWKHFNKPRVHTQFSTWRFTDFTNFAVYFLLLSPLLSSFSFNFFSCILTFNADS